ncbi:ChuX/HutX family heme-like substrate-binding protein [Oricola sp.]|uniref:hemin-degrading factor n=1 Tax=Oricola sp. TaxID=1979950 RepID=UPI0025FACFCB|nr:ChuX/HutX family heme-like substrate-binding protein [Oricola sp.]MCI5076943.1 hemin-degrading factor [Oricola sp.]
MTIATPLTFEDIRAAQAADPKTRERDLAAKLGISEGEFTAAFEGHGVTRLQPDLDLIFPRLEQIGELMALSRNEHAVHEKIGVYDKYQSRERVPMVLGKVMDLRLFKAHWVHAFAVEKPAGDTVKRSLQFFDAHGDAVHKIHCRASSDLDAWQKLVTDLRLPADASVPGFAPPAQRAAVPEPDDNQIAELRQRWAAIEDTHEFQGMIARLGFKRLQAIRVMGDEFTWRVGDDAMETVLTGAAAGAVPLMVFVRNPGILQIHSGPVVNIKRTGDWLNVMDPDFHLHLRTTAICECWAIRRPSKDGDVLSVEAYDADGNRILLINGIPGETQANRPDWINLVRSLPCHDSAVAA